MRKKFLLFLLVLIGGMALVGCKEPVEPEVETFKLTLPQGVTSNQENLAKVAKDANVVLTVTIPEGKEIESFKVDGVEKKGELVNNKLSFKMTKDIVVTVSFKELIVVKKYKLTLPAGVTADFTNLAEVPDNVDVTLTVAVPAGKEINSFKIAGQERKNDLDANNKIVIRLTKDTTVTVEFVAYHALTLPEGVTADVSNPQRILEGKEVVLTVAVPAGHEIASFKVDGVEKKGALVNNKLTISMTKDIVVELSYVAFFGMTLPEGVTANVTDLTHILSGTEVELTVAVPEHHELTVFKVDGEDKLASLQDNKLTVTVNKNIAVEVTFVSLAPQLTGELYDWMPGAIADTTGLVATFVAPKVEIDEVTGAGMTVLINAIELEFLVDYDIVEDKLTVFGQALENANLALGQHLLKITTVHGTAELEFNVVDNPINTSIPTKTIKGYNMAEIEPVTITAPIADAPALLITEINFDLGVYEHIEVFNNTNEPYNLKGHRIVFADLAKQKNELGGLFHEPLGMYSSIYIDEDLIIPALSPAILWIVNGRPWNVETSGSPRKVVETADAKNYLFEGVCGGKLSIAAFKEGFGIAEAVPVFPLRPHYMLARTDNGWNYEAGVGLTMAKNANWSGNSGMDNRGVQIQKISDEKFSVDLIDASASAAIPAGATHFVYEFKVFNKEQDVYVDGALDSTKMVHNGARESVNSLALRMRFFDGEGNDLGLPLVATKYTGFDIYNANFAAYVEFVERAVTPVVSAVIYQNIDGEEYASSGKRWPERASMQYTIPNHEAPFHMSTYMRFVVPQTEFSYANWYGAADPLKDMKLMCISTVAAPEIYMNKDVIVPEDPGYPTTYLNNYGHTAGIIGWYNLYLTQPE